MKITLAVVGRLKESYFAEAEAEYTKRLRPYCTLSIVEHKDDAAMLAAIPATAHLYVFDERGATMSSKDFAEKLLGTEAQHGGGAPIVFAIGGADGHTDAIRSRAKKLISYGQMTIAHRLVRLLTLEQLYRAFRILRGEPYHRD
ncbi:MAG: 23S rRNA (pseudouridine(1915)-N(3))-methyltransferase RlmH [Deltaproteobacteria bacterium]|nr:23S rRNA (pseudouridine(1915)-N(3))-methyltransferase RlmH [Deltaproteobacteria bacterium]